MTRYNGLTPVGDTPQGALCVHPLGWSPPDGRIVRYNFGWRIERGGAVRALCQPAVHGRGHQGDVYIGHVYRHRANPRYWVAETLEGYLVPTDGRTQKEAGHDLYTAYRMGVAPPRETR